MTTLECTVVHVRILYCWYQFPCGGQGALPDDGLTCLHSVSHATKRSSQVRELLSVHPYIIPSPVLDTGTMNDDLSYEEELLLQVAGRSRPGSKPQAKKRSRRAVSISDDDDEDYRAQSDGGDEEEDGEAPMTQDRGKRSAPAPSKKRKGAADDEEVGCEMRM